MLNVTVNATDTPYSLSFYGNVGTAAVQILSKVLLNIPIPSNARVFLQIHNPSATAYLAYTTDGTTPVVNGTGYTLIPYGSTTFDIRVVQGPITLIGSASSSPYTITTM